jgi:NADPH:quinone reductase-like Zn-dependent oxidoreductase
MSTSAPLLAATSSTALVHEPMRAVVQHAYGGPEVLHLGTIAAPTPGDHEVLVRVQAAALDRGTWHLMTGRPYLMRLMGFGLRAPKQPVAGLDLAGTIAGVGPGVTRWRVGDVVFGIGRGSFAEYAVAHEDKLAAVPKGVAKDDAAALAVSGITALEAIDKGGLVAGERVLVVGASGGVGTYAVQIAKARGAHVTAVCSTAKVELVRSLGVDRVIDYRTQDFTEDDARYDLVLDVGGNTSLSRLRRIMTATGRLVFVGGENGGDWTAGFGRQLGAMLLGLFVKQRFVMLMSSEGRAPLEQLAALCEAGQVRPVVGRRIELSEVGATIVDMEAGRIAGKVVVRIA